MSIVRFCFTAILLVNVVSVSFAGTLEDAIMAIESGELERGYLILLKEANSGNAEAQDELGAFYHIYREDSEEAFKWYKKSAEQGYADAQYNVGAAYDIGQGVERDINKAIIWYRLAAAQNHVIARNNLALCYLNGEGVPTDYKKAFELLSKSAYSRTDALADRSAFVSSRAESEILFWITEAQVALGVLYYQGQGVEKDQEMALAWWVVAASLGNEKAQRNIDRTIDYLSDDSVENVKKLATEILKKLSD